MTLKEQLSTRAATIKQKLAFDKWSIMDKSTAALIAIDLSKKALKTGDVIKDFTLPSSTNKQITFSEILKHHIVVLSFYRGGWCPYCNMELKALQKILPQLEAKGVKLIAISPELPDKSYTTAQKNELAFEILSDVNNKVAKDFRLVFKMPKDLQDLYVDQFDIHVDQHNGNSKYELPMAATYVIKQDGTIIYDFISENYTERAEPFDILASIEALN